MRKVRNNLYSAKENRKLNILLNAALIAVLVILCVELIFGVIYSGFYVVGNSMSPTLTGAASETTAGGDYVYVDANKQPDYGDIVVVMRDENGARVPIIKRVIALGGDTVWLNHGVLYIKYRGEKQRIFVNEPYVNKLNNTGANPRNTFPTENGALIGEGHLVKEGCMFLMGDNRDISNDSRGELRDSSGIDFPLDDLCGVVTKWSISGKSFFTAVHEYFIFKLPSYFGIK